MANNGYTYNSYACSSGSGSNNNNDDDNAIEGIFHSFAAAREKTYVMMNKGDDDEEEDIQMTCKYLDFDSPESINSDNVSRFSSNSPVASSTDRKKTAATVDVRSVPKDITMALDNPNFARNKVWHPQTKPIEITNRSINIDEEHWLVTNARLLVGDPTQPSNYKVVNSVRKWKQIPEEEP